MKRQGFTLIELLAVIVILAIIALIATPTILGVIEKARKGSTEQSALGYIDAVEKQIAINELDESKTNIVDGVYEVSNLKTLGVSIKGENPSDNSWVKISKNVVTNYSLKFKDYTVTYGKDSVKNGDIATKPSGEVTYTVYPNGTAIYYNPETNQKCEDYAEANSTTGTKTGCMKWYTFNDEETSVTVNMILDHNTTAGVAYNSAGNNSVMNEVKLALTNDTTTWNNSLNVRLITADEIAKISDNKNFSVETFTINDWFYLDSNNHTQTATTQGSSKYAWLFDYTNDCTGYGCNIADSSNHGYWTSNPLFNVNYLAWGVHSQGGLSYDNIVATSYGVRPVITVSKSVIS